jgi:hypothetical protein
MKSTRRSIAGGGLFGAAPVHPGNNPFGNGLFGSAPPLAAFPSVNKTNIFATASDEPSYSGVLTPSN